MSGRALIAVGCDTYEHLDNLTGAEADARSLFEVLIDPKTGDYEGGLSRLLLSPTLQEIRDALESTLFNKNQLDTLTITFAGHGAVVAGSYYMAIHDTKLNALSATAWPLADLFRMIAESAPKQTYLILDACESGGLISDLNVILKSDVMGELGTPGLALLATAASNEVAGETGGQGIGTAAILDCIRGDVMVQDTNPALDLIEIGRSVSERISAASGQTPVVWGLNLYGPSSFCRNPHVNSGDAPLRSVLRGWPDRKTVAALQEGMPRLWEPYITISSRWDAREFLDQLAPLLCAIGDNNEAQINFVTRLADACAAQANDARDRFREIEVRAACAVAMLPRTADPNVERYLATTCADISGLVEQTISQITSELREYRYALVTGGLGDLFDLPVRISKLLGWAGYSLHANDLLGRDFTRQSQMLNEFTQEILGTYALSLVSMSDQQAPYVLSALMAYIKSGNLEGGEALLGHMFASAVSCRGKVARVDLKPSKVLAYLLMRHNDSVNLNSELAAQPSELIMVLLRASKVYGLDDEFDLALFDLDHLPINAYLAQEFGHFGESHIPGGRNAIFQIGDDVWSVADIDASWPSTPTPQGGVVSAACVMASLLFPDRTPWFLLPS